MLSISTKARVIGLKKAGLSNYLIWQRLKPAISKGSVYRLLKSMPKIEQENKDNNIYNNIIEKVKKDEIEILNAQISLIDSNLTDDKAYKESFRSLVVSKAVLLDKRELLSGRATERIDVEGMTHQERIVFIRTGHLPERMGDSRIKDLCPSTSQS